MSRARPLLAVAAVAGLGAAAAGLQAWATAEVEAALTARGVTWAARSVRVGRVSWSGLRAEGVALDALEVTLAPLPRVRARGATVDLARLADAADLSAAAGAGPGSRLAGLADPPVVVDGLAVTWGETPLWAGWSGTVRPAVRLQGDDGHLRQTDGAWVGRLERPLAAGPLSGEAVIDARCPAAGPCTLSVRMDEAVLEHPLLAPGPVGPAPLRVSLEVDREARTGAGTARLGGATATVEADGAAVILDARQVPLSSLVELFAPYLPEARTAAVTGTLGAKVTLDLEARAVTAIEPAAAGLSAEGALPDPGALRGGELTWRAPVAGGDWVPRTTGDGLPGWTPLRAAGLVPHAMIAAEDAAFRSHGGWHLPAVEAALSEWVTEPESALRGGSTITQQLAKNLFCDPLDRTLARKLRELVLALDLERALPKERILELYINVVELGPALYGVGPAADAYFLKQPARLTPTEAAYLAAILPSPRRGYQRAVDGRAPRTRMAYILDNMVLGGTLDRPTADRAARAPLRIVPIER